MSDMSDKKDAKVLRGNFPAYSVRPVAAADDDSTADKSNVVLVDFAADTKASALRFNPVLEDLARGYASDETTPTGRPSDLIEANVARRHRVIASAHKLAHFERMIGQGIVMVMLDPTQPGVVLPDSLLGHVSLNLNFSLKYGLKDFVYDKQGVRATLSFSKRETFCIVPWTAVFGLRLDEENFIWPETMPAVLRSRLKELPPASEP